MVDIRRRITFKGIGIALLGGLSGGCCTTSHEIDAKPNSKNLLNSLALPTELTSAKNYFPIIDAHAHFFNATDIQAGGYLTGPVANEWGISSNLLTQIGKVVGHIANIIAPSASQEWVYLASLDQLLRNTSFSEKQNKLDIELDKQNKKITDALFKELNTKEFKQEFKRVMGSTGFYQKNREPEFSEELLYKAITDDYGDITRSKAFAEKTFKIDPRRVLAIFGFVGRMLNYRSLNIHAYRKAYFLKSRDIKTVSACDALVDFDYWVGDCDLSYSRMKDQILLHQRLAQVNGDYVFPLAAYNPWSAIKDNYRYLDLIEDAIKHRGFKGVKIYPPIGYYPIDNSEPGRYPVNYKHPDLKELDNSLMKLYEITKHYDVPVMAHGNHSMGRNDEHKMMGGPDAWRRLYEKKGYDQFKTNIGHFGGTSPDQYGHSWSEAFIELMKKNKNLYADVGYWDKLMKPEFTPTLVALLNKNLGAGQMASQRIMFGTDWFMLNMVPDWRKYTGRIYANLKHYIHDNAVLKAFFHDNAKRFYKL